MSKMKKVVTLLLALIMVVGLLPTAFADNSVIVYGESGKTYEEVVELYGKDAADKWDWLLKNRDSRHADVYLWYLDSDGFTKAENFRFLCSPDSAAFYNSIAPDIANAELCTDETTHQMALDQLKKDSEAMYRYLTVGDITLEEAKGESKKAPTQSPSVSTPTTDPATGAEPATDTKPATSTDTGSAPYVDITFVDVNEGDWYYEAVMALAHTGILNGKGNGVFDPNANITVGEMAALICRIDKLANPVPFVSGETLETKLYGKRTFTEPTSWAHEYIMGVRKARGQMVDFYDLPKWDPEAFAEPVRRGEAMRVAVSFASRMTRYTEYYREDGGWGLGPRNAGFHALTEKFVPDLDTSSLHNNTCACTEYEQKEHAWNSDHIRYAYLCNIVHGVDDKGTANAHGYLTRAEFCQMLYNMGIKDGNTVNNPHVVPDVLYTIPQSLDELLAMWK